MNNYMASEDFDRALGNARLALEGLEEAVFHTTAAKESGARARQEVQGKRRTSRRRAADKLEQADVSVRQAILNLKIAIAELEAEEGFDE